VKVKEFATRLGTSSIAFTVKDIFAVLEFVPSVAVKTKFPKEFNSEFAFSAEEKEISESWDEVNSVPAASRTPSEVVRVKPLGMESTVMEVVPLGVVIENDPGVSSLKVNDWLENEKDGAAGLLPPPPPPPQEANVMAARFAKIKEDFPFS
tara:strand:+ start:864 stop:1316 length:453 start_codon:yes stop_codon:yes gene_type:complete